MASLKTRYGGQEGEQIYYRMERERRGPFAPGNKCGDFRLGARSPDRRSEEKMLTDVIRSKREKAEHR